MNNILIVFTKLVQEVYNKEFITTKLNKLYIYSKSYPPIEPRGNEPIEFPT